MMCCLTWFQYVTRHDSFSQNHHSGHFGRLAIPLSAEEMHGEQRQRVDIPAHTSDNGLRWSTEEMPGGQGRRVDIPAHACQNDSQLSVEEIPGGQRQRVDIPAHACQNSLRWPAEKMPGGKRQRVGIPAHIYARTCHNGRSQKRLEEDLCRIVLMPSPQHPPPPTTQSVMGLK